MIEVVAERPVAGGRMLARHEGRVVLVAGAIPGERVRARIERATRQVTWATVVDVLEASPDRRPPACDLGCGGSSYAHVRYERQLDLKADVVADAFRRIGKITLDAPVPVAASSEHGYRVRARLHVRQGRAGFFREGTHALCDAGPTGQLLPETTAAVDATLAALGSRVSECDAVTVSENVQATERVIHLEPREGSRFDDLRHRIDAPAGVSGITTVTSGRVVGLAGGVVVTDTSAQLFGAQSPIGSLAVWTRHAMSFFQGNRFLTAALVRRVLELAAGDHFIDLYSGVGLFAIALAARGARGLAVEGDPWSGTDLQANASAWRDRLRVMRASVEEASRLPLDPSPDVVVLDPPRTGVSAEALSGILAWQSPRLVYVSCDPPTLARDVARLVANGYTLQSIDALDLFPNTPHVEVVVALELVAARSGADFSAARSRAASTNPPNSVEN